MPELQFRAIAVAEKAFNITVAPGLAPPWLLRPGRAECGPLWPTVSTIYSTLTDGQILPDVMPPRERRTVDGLVRDSRGATRILEIDETQHFNAYRQTSLDLYPPDATVAFPVELWTEACDRKARFEGGGFGRPKPPLFDLENGRHRQRAFRDALADLLPSLHGWGPTIRIADFELQPWIWQSDAAVEFGKRFGDRFNIAAVEPVGAPKAAPVSEALPPRMSVTAQTQPVTPVDVANGRIRIPAATKPSFPSSRSTVSITLRGVPMRVPYDPRNGPDRPRSGVLRIGRAQLARVVQPHERLTVLTKGGVINLD